MITVESKRIYFNTVNKEFECLLERHHIVECLVELFGNISEVEFFLVKRIDQIVNGRFEL